MRGWRALLGLVWLAGSSTEAEQVVISKIMHSPLKGQPEYIEVYNNTATPFDIANWKLAGRVHYDFPDFSSNQPAASFLKGFERIVVVGKGVEQARAAYGIPEAVRLFGPWKGNLTDESERITLKDKNGVALCSVKHGIGGLWPPAVNGHPLVLRDANRGVDDWRNWTLSDGPGGSPGRAATLTNGTNRPSLAASPTKDIVINEIMFDPPSVLTNASQFIELYNRGKGTVDLSGWRLAEGVEFEFPRQSMMAAGAYLVVAANTNQLREAYGNIPMIGNFKGKLSHHGELLRLLDSSGKLVNEVDYRSGGDWPELSAGGGSSMELINPWMDNTLASAWRASDESGKGPFREYTYTGAYEELHTKGLPSDYKELHFHLVGDAHLVLKDIWFGKKGSTNNYILNGDKLSDDGLSAKGWLCQGTHWASYTTNGELHLISDGRGDNRANRAEIDVVGMKKGETCELKFKARWISGIPRLIAQTWDHSIANSFLIDLPRNLGTPGARNSCSPALLSPTTATPQIDALLHSPAVPRSTNTIRVTAKLSSAFPLVSVQTICRTDSANGNRRWTNIVMNDQGTNGDSVAGDGVWTAEIRPKRNGQVVQFYVIATATNGQTCLLPREGEEAPAMFVVDDRPVPRDLRTARFIVSAFDLGAMGDGNNPKYNFKFPRHANHYFNCTVISNEEEIFYNGQVRNSGSPWTRGGGLDRPKFKLPNDRRFRSHSHFYYDNDPAGGNFHNRVTRYWLYLLGHPVSESEIVRVVVNNYGIDLREETEPVRNDFLNRNFNHGSHGQLYRIDDEWWFTDDWDRDQRDAEWEYKGSDNPGRYRTEWMKRTNEAEDDFSGLIAFFKLVSTGKYTQAEIEKFLDARAVAKYAVVRGYIADWDNFTMGRGKNGFFYQRPNDGVFQFLQWDSDLAFGDPNSGFYGRITPWVQKPWNNRLFHYYLAEFHEKYTKDSARFKAWLQAEEDASNSYSPNPSFYIDWCDRREAAVLRELGPGYKVSVKINPVNPSNTVTKAVVNLTGTAPWTVFNLELAGSNAKPEWKPGAKWSFTNVVVHPGKNFFLVKGKREDGTVVQQARMTVTNL